MRLRYAVFALALTSNAVLADPISEITKELFETDPIPIVSPEDTSISDDWGRVAFVYGRGYRALAIASDAWLQEMFSRGLLKDEEGVYFVWQDEGAAMLYLGRILAQMDGIDSPYLEQDPGSLRFMNHIAPGECQIQKVCKEAWWDYCRSLPSIAIWPTICREYFEKSN